MTSRPGPISATDPALVVANLQAFHEWFWPPEVRRETVAETDSSLPVALQWAMKNQHLFEHQFLAEPEVGPRIRCFEECGGAFEGFEGGGVVFFGENNKQWAIAKS